ncbi:MAG: alpha/beta fold hydrolase [Balneolaceae bacterium]|nr:MAG: alpha/beta fold hydrolase [Balneolaceae bacterium]
MIQLIADSVKYSCTIHKSNSDFPYLLMLHGFMGSADVFNPLLETLKSFCNPITIDLAGHGRTETPDTDGILSAQNQIKQLQSLLERLSFSNLFIYGYSMGGRLAFQLISNSPGNFKGAIIESAHCGINEENQRKKRRLLDAERADALENGFTDFIDEWVKMPLFANTPAKAAEIYESIMRAQVPALMARSLREFGAGVIPAVNKNLPLDLPVHLISGSFDTKYVQLQKEIADQSVNFQHHIIGEAGHRVHTDKPLEVVRIIKDTVTSFSH